jgi:hypothetical protein
VTAIPCGPGVAHCACVAELRAENEKLRALLAEWVSLASTEPDLLQRTFEFLGRKPECAYHAPGVPHGPCWITPQLSETPSKI